MTDFFLGMLNQSLAASWLVLAVLVVRFLLKKAPKWVPVLLWGLVAIRLLSPFTIESSASLLPDPAPITETVVTEHLSVEQPETLEIQAYNAYDESPRPIERSYSVVEMFSVVWLVGAVGILLYASVRYSRLRRRIATAIPMRDNIYQSEHVTSPFVMGFFCPRIYLPFVLPEQDIVYVVSHEQTHIRRGDHWWKLLGFLLLAVHWMNPLIWLAYQLLCHDIELACDERVIRHLSREQRAGYSQALLSCSVHRSTLTVFPLAFGEVGVKERVKNVLCYKKPAFWTIIVAVCTCAVVAVCFMTSPKTSNIAGVPFGDSYQVEAIVYDAAYYDFSYTLETAPRYALTSNQILQICENQEEGWWIDVGKCSEIELSKERFDDYFQTDEVWNGSSARKLRAENKQAWRVVADDSLSNTIFYNLLLQKNGDVYLTYGYYDRSLLSSVFFETPSIQWVFKLTKQSTPVGGDEKEPDLLDVHDAIPDLDAAITAAVLEHCADDGSEELIDVESHIILEQIELAAAPEKERHKNTVTVYAMVLNLKYRVEDDVLTNIGGRHGATALSFDVDAEGNYILTEYWEPRPGSYCAPDIRQKFPKTVAEQAISTQPYVETQKKECLAKAQAILAQKN